MPTKTLQIPTTDGQADAFAAFPDHGERRPGVLMYADGFGIRPVLREMARELAGHGYYVLVPNLFYRHGLAPLIDLPDRIGEEVRPALMAQLMPLIEAHTAERVLRDADAYLRFLSTQPEVAAGPVAVTGYCIGGLLAMRTAAAHPGQVAAVAAFHGPVGADGPDTRRDHRPGPLRPRRKRPDARGPGRAQPGAGRREGRLHLRDLPRHRPRVHHGRHRRLRPRRTAAPLGPPAPLLDRTLANS